MKMKYILLALMTLCIVSCSEEETVVSVGNGQEVQVTAGMDKHSRMVLNDQGTHTESLWQNGDKISLFTATQSNLSYSTSLESASATAGFIAMDESLQYIEGNTVYACYPSVTVTADDHLVVNLPTTDSFDYNDGTVRSFCYAVDAITSGKLNFKFKHLSCFLGLTVTPGMLSDASKGISKVTVSTSSTEPLSIGEGDTFDFSTLEASTTHGSNTVQMNVDNQVFETEWMIYVPILPQPAGADITITLSDSEGTTLYTMTKQTPEAGFQAGYVYKQGATGSYETSYLVDGETFNAAIKDLVNGNIASRGRFDDNEKIAKIKFMTEVEALPEEYITVSAEDSPVPIYASFNAADSLLTISTAAKSMEIVDASYMFYRLIRLHTIDLGNFKITEKTTDASLMFSYCSGLTSLNVSSWDTSNVTDMSFMFGDCSSLTFLDVSNWDLSNVTDMSYIFENCSGLTSLDVSGWDTSNVIDMYHMFNGCSNLNILDISNWDTSNVTSMGFMFSDCSGLTSLDVSGWDTSNVTNMGGTFSSSGLISLDVSGWNTSSVIDMSHMFSGTGITSLDVSGWNTSKVTTMKQMFNYCKELISLDVSKWDTSNVTDMMGVFGYCSGLTTLDVSNWNTSNVTNMGSMFSDCSSLVTLDVSNWNTSNVTNMGGMFYFCKSLTTLDVSNWDTGKVTSMVGMFHGCSALSALNVSDWNTSSLTDMHAIFSDCSSVKTLDVSKWNTANVTSMRAVFSGCSSLSALEISNWNTANVTDMSSIFSGCSEVTTLNVSDWDTSNVTDMSFVFGACPKVTTLDISNWSFKEDVDLLHMFDNCASTSKSCKITATPEAKAFLLSETGETEMNTAWFIWGDATNDGSSFDNIPKEEW